MGDTVMVFAPAPQLTVTIEKQHDRAELHVHAGGQGIWQTRMITALGAQVTLCASVGGEVGAVLTPLLALDGVTVRTVARGSGSGWYVHDRRGGSREEIAEDPGTPLSRHELDELYSVALAEGLRAGHARFWLDGHKLRGGWSLQRMRDSDWLLIKRRDEGADARRRPTSTQPESVLSGRTVEQVAAEST
jgi:hypothetical protein